MKKVFLGGTCNGSDWRNALIPLLKIGYFNPVVDDWTPDCMAEELRQREECDYCLYVITPRMEGFFSIAEVVDDSNKRPEKVLFLWLPMDRSDDAEELAGAFSVHQMKSLEQVEAMVRRNGGRVFEHFQAVADYLNGEEVE